MARYLGTLGGFLASIALLSLFERKLTAQAEKPPFFRPFFWVDISILALNTAIGTLVQPMRPFIRFLYINVPTSSLALPFWLQVIIGILLIDFTHFLGHVFLHRATYISSIHRVHHASSTLDAPTAYKRHPLEVQIHALASLLPLSIMIFCGFDRACYVIGFWVLMVWTAFQHLEVPAPRPWRGWVWIGYVFLLPWHHRVHHQAGSTNKNYAIVFSMWDRLFGSYQALETINLTNSVALFPYVESGPYPRALWRQFVNPFGGRDGKIQF